ncbi:hypothetical protein NEOLEDRAFT_1166297 [Neolentinus lepideus HHB14362 ss-1]|uniref:Uncharacterized protein n=1 Tax=Neolentinus lepideus HHB14362 ss-1 TaxID=1314782 RepID=A0A165VPR8_9AGAM|nr:hypothetical protein NEOLEDRAFT_1166297 [Neolentinus lepideus HHB14362 ss-1]
MIISRGTDTLNGGVYYSQKESPWRGLSFCTELQHWMVLEEHENDTRALTQSQFSVTFSGPIPLRPLRVYFVVSLCIILGSAYSGCLRCRMPRTRTRHYKYRRKIYGHSCGISVLRMATPAFLLEKRLLSQCHQILLRYRYLSLLVSTKVLRENPPVILHATTQYELPPSPPDSSETGTERVVSSSTVEGEEKKMVKKSIVTISNETAESILVIVARGLFQSFLPNMEGVVERKQ